MVESPAEYRVESSEIRYPGEIEGAWIELQSRSDCSYFQSWGWIGTWLEQIAIDLHPVTVRVWFEDTLVGMGIFVPKSIHRRLVVRSETMFLNEFPFDGRNMVIEYNGLLADPKHKRAVYSHTIAHLFRTHRNRDELFFGATMDRETLQAALAEGEGLGGELEQKNIEASTAWFLDLTGLGQGVEAFLATLSKNRRAQIRRAIRLYETEQSLFLQEAATADQALTYFEGLKKLHSDHWRSKGLRGSFANPRWESFHRALIQSRFPEGEIQMLKVGTSMEAIGYLYNFVWRKRVYVLQTGFKFGTDKRLMPGYVVHVLAIAHNRQKGMEAYDLMHGDDLYKRILCNRRQTLHWLVMQRKRLKFRLEDFFVTLVRCWRQR